MYVRVCVRAPHRWGAFAVFTTHPSTNMVGMDEGHEIRSPEPGLGLRDSPG